MRGPRRSREPCDEPAAPQAHVKRWLPAPLLSLALMALWLILSNDIGPASVLMALLLGVVVPLRALPLRPTPVRMRRPWLACRLFFRVGGDVIVSNWRVLRGTLARGDRLPRGGFVTVPLELRDPNGAGRAGRHHVRHPRHHLVGAGAGPQRAAACICSRSTTRRPRFEIIKSRYERPLREIFE